MTKIRLSLLIYHNKINSTIREHNYNLRNYNNSPINLETFNYINRVLDEAVLTWNNLEQYHKTIRNRNKLKTGCGSTFTKFDLTGRIFSNMLFELFAPQTLKGVAATIQGFRFGKIGRFTAQIAKL